MRFPVIGAPRPGRGAASLIVALAAALALFASLDAGAQEFVFEATARTSR